VPTPTTNWVLSLTRDANVAREDPVVELTRMRIYLDNNPYDYLLGSGVSPEALSKALQGHGHELIISGDNFQEWASCWKSRSPKTEEVGRRLLRYVLDIEPRRLIAGPDQLIKREMAAALGESLPGPFLPPEDVATAEALFRRFIDGAPSETDREALLSRWAEKEASARRATELGGGRAAPDVSPSLDHFIRSHPDGYKRTVHAYIKKNFQPASGAQIKFFAKRLHKCPALRAAIRADLYVNWRIATGKKMQQDRWDDLRHCIVSSYSDLFVTRDEGLESALGEIKPGPRIVRVAEFATLLNIPYAGP